MILLASRSPQRRALLGQLGVEFRVVASAFEEHASGSNPIRVVEANARGKARDVAARTGIPVGGAVLGADTEVVLDGAVLGKPADSDRARAMLTQLAGRDHDVVTGVALLTADREVVTHEVTRVTMRALSDAEIAWYLGTGEWRDRAGAYGLQGAGAALFSRIDGDPANVVGLPLARVAELLRAAGLWPVTAGSGLTRGG